MFKVFKLLNHYQIKLFFAIGILIIFLSFFEILTFALLQPIVDYFAENSSSDLFINKVFFFKSLSIKHILLFFFICFILRGFLTIFISYKKHGFIKNINDYLCDKILSNYLNKDYIFFLENKTSSMSSVIVNEVEKFSYRLVDNCINLFTETFVVLAILIFLLINYFNETLFLALITFLFFGLFYFFYKSQFKKLGSLKSKADSQKMQDLQNSFFAIQSIKLENLENIFIKNFKISTQKSSESQFYLGFMSELPKPLIEFLVIIIIFFMLGISYFYFDFDNKKILSTIGLFVVAMFRLLPSTNKIIGSLNAIKFYSSSSKIITEELKKFEILLTPRNVSQIETENNLLFEKNIILKDIKFAYPLKNKNILNKLNLQINKNNMVAILGSNGSGKSTLLNILCSLLKPNSGEILIDNMALSPEKIKSYQKKISFVQQKTVLFNDSILNNIIFGNSYNENNNYEFLHLQKILNNSNLKNFIDNLPLKMNTYIGDMGKNLSGGEIQKIAIARALYKKSEILILDEATSALDDESEKDIIKTILSLKGKITIVIVTHKKNILQYCDKVYNLEQIQSGE